MEIVQNVACSCRGEYLSKVNYLDSHFDERHRSSQQHEDGDLETQTCGNYLRKNFCSKISDKKMVWNMFEWMAQ